MRNELEKINEVRDTFVGTFERFGTKHGYKGMEYTIVLLNIKNKEGKIVCDHLWFNLTKGFDNLKLKQGDIVQFDARVKEYVKGYKGYREDVYRPLEIDFKLSHPTKLKKLIGEESE